MTNNTVRSTEHFGILIGFGSTLTLTGNVVSHAGRCLNITCT